MGSILLFWHRAGIDVYITIPHKMLYKKNNMEDIQLKGGEVEVIFIDYHKNLGCL